MRDLIDRQMVIDMLATMQGRCTSKVALIQNSKIWQQIKDMPSAQPERKKGKWINEDSIYETVTCSVCHGVRRDNRINHINFCNCCGADMRGENNETN